MSKKDKKVFVFNTALAIEGLYILSLFWIGYNLLVFIPKRPAEIFSPMSYFGRIFSPEMPSLFYYFSIFVISIISNVLLFTNRFKNILFLRIIHLFTLLWINNIKWSFGFLSHVDHLFLLTFLLSLFISRKLPDTKEETEIKAFNYKIYYFGLLITYSLSATWKIYYVILNFITRHPRDDWSAKKALLYTAATNNLISGETFALKAKILQVPYLSEIAFWVATIMMLFACFSVINYRYFRITLFTLILFHLANTYFINAVFWVSPAILLMFLIPYNKILAGKFDRYDAKLQ